MPRPLPWQQATGRIHSLREEAMGFLERAAQRFASASPDHFPLVARLWAAAEDADLLVHRLLEEMNRELLRGKGDIDVSRGGYVLESPGTRAGAAVQADPEAAALPDIDWQAAGLPQSPFLRAQSPALSALMAVPPQPPASEELVYNCTWSLRWEEDRAVTVDLGITADDGRLSLRVLGERSHLEQHLSHPVPEDTLQAALATAYVAEGLGDEAPSTRPSKAASKPTQPRKRAARAARFR
ncbi:MAG: hypothetical protein FJ315_00955 [SAR202 cluster bacterium]|nr:hypothetical protein [SAR202 cluster bacterium]